MKIGILLFAFTILFISCGEKGHDQPNIIILYSDDHRAISNGFMGNMEISTPNLDQLANISYVFTQAHIMGGRSGALCIPSRAMLHTGRDVNDLEGSGNRIPTEHITIPEYFSSLGYTTFITGKWHNDKASLSRIYSHGESLYLGGMHWPEDGGHFNPLIRPFDTTGRFPDSLITRSDLFSSTTYTNAAIDFLDKHENDGSPFMLYVAYTSPHDPRTPPKEYVMSSEEVTLPANFMADHPFNNGDLSVRDEKLLGRPLDTSQVKREIANYYGMIEELDHQIGRIINSLEAKGILDNTIIVFAGDNGLALGSHGLLGKQNLYDPTLRIPLIIKPASAIKRKDISHFASIPDIFPTLAELTGNNIPPSVTGKSLIPSIEKDIPVRENMYFLYRDIQRGVKSPEGWKLIKYIVDGEIRSQLFNTKTDPFELNNLFDSASFNDIKNKMEDLLLREMKANGDDLDPSQPYFGKKLPRKRKYESLNLLGNAKVNYNRPLDNNYPGNQLEKSLIDGVTGTDQDHTINWQGFQGDSLIIDFELDKPVLGGTFEMGILENQGAWIFLPKSIEISISTDGINFNQVHSEVFQINKSENNQIFLYKKELSESFKFIKIQLNSINIIPTWHPGGGNPPWLFIDEIHLSSN